MELLIAAIITLLVRLVKKISIKLGKEVTDALVLIFSFLVSTLFVFVYKSLTSGIEWQNLDSIISVFGISMAYYEILIKRFIKPILDKYGK